MKIALFGKLFNESFTDSFKLMFEEFAKHNVEVDIYEPFYDFLIREINFKPPVNNYYHGYHDIDRKSVV